MSMRMMMKGWMSAALLAALVSGAHGATASAPSNVLGDYAVFALNEVTLRGRVNVVSGDVGCNASQGLVSLVDRAKVTGAVAAYEVRLGRGATAGAYFCTRGPAECVPATQPLIDPAALPIVQADPGTEDVRLGKKKVLDPLAPGTYNVVKLGTSARLVLSGGDYVFRSIDLRKKAQLVCLAACQIFVAERVRVGDGAVFGAEAPLEATEVRVDVKGGGDLAAFRTFRRASVTANVYAPNGAIVLGQNAKAKGAFVGQRFLAYPLAQIEAASVF